MSIENTEELYPEQDVFVHCKGSVLSEDFEHKMELVYAMHCFFTDAYEAVNDFSDSQNRVVLGETLKNETYCKHTNSILLHIDFGLYFPSHFAACFVEIIKNRTESFISSKVEIRIGSCSETVKKYFFEKVKTDKRVEVECNGKLSFNTGCYKGCLTCFENLAFKLTGSFFKYPNVASPDIFVTDLIHLHLRSHCFIEETNIEKNVSEIKKAFDASFYGKITITINGEEQLFAKEADWSLVKPGETRNPYNCY